MTETSPLGTVCRLKPNMADWGREKKHPKWQERPLACVVAKPGAAVTKEQIYHHLEENFARRWLPDDITFIELT